MNKFFDFINVKVFLILVIGFSFVDLIGGYGILWLFKNSKSGIALKEKVVFFETNQDVLIFGSSRAAFHYDPSVLENNSNLTFYNAGREGTGVFFHYAALIATLERYQPKKIILDVDFRDVYDRGGDFGENVFGQLKPYYGLVNDEFDDYIMKDPIDKVLYQSNLLKFNKKFLNIITSNISSNDKTIKGFKSLNGSWDGKIQEIDESFNLSQAHIDVLDSFIVKSKQKKIELILVISPTNKKVPSEFYEIIQKKSRYHNIKLIDFHNTKELMLKEYFHDYEHLNQFGAKAFSSILSKKI